MNLTRRELFVLGAGGVAACVGVAVATTKRKPVKFFQDRLIITNPNEQVVYLISDGTNYELGRGTFNNETKEIIRW